MKLKDTKIQKLLVSRQRVPLSPLEQEVADYIAEAMRTGLQNAALFIWEVCQDAGVDHHKIAKHLGARLKK